MRRLMLGAAADVAAELPVKRAKRGREEDHVAHVHPHPSTSLQLNSTESPRASKTPSTSSAEWHANKSGVVESNPNTAAHGTICSIIDQGDSANMTPGCSPGIKRSRPNTTGKGTRQEQCGCRIAVEY